MKLPGHQNLFNGDCDIHFYQAPWNHWRPKKGGRHSAQAVHHMVDLLARSGVDTYLVNPNGQRAYYPSKVVPTHIDGYKRGDRKFIYAHILGQPIADDRDDHPVARGNPGSHAEAREKDGAALPSRVARARAFRSASRVRA